MCAWFEIVGGKSVWLCVCVRVPHAHSYVCMSYDINELRMYNYMYDIQEFLWGMESIWLTKHAAHL